MNTTHAPTIRQLAIDAHYAGRSRQFGKGYDWTAYVVSVDGLPYVVTVWNNGDVGAQPA